MKHQLINKAPVIAKPSPSPALSPALSPTFKSPGDNSLDAVLSNQGNDSAVKVVGRGVITRSSEEIGGLKTTPTEVIGLKTTPTEESLTKEVSLKPKRQAPPRPPMKVGGGAGDQTDSADLSDGSQHRGGVANVDVGVVKEDVGVAKDDLEKEPTWKQGLREHRGEEDVTTATGLSAKTKPFTKVGGVALPGMIPSGAKKLEQEKQVSVWGGGGGGGGGSQSTVRFCVEVCNLSVFLHTFVHLCICVGQIAVRGGEEAECILANYCIMKLRNLNSAHLNLYADYRCWGWLQEKDN